MEESRFFSEKSFAIGETLLVHMAAPVAAQAPPLLLLLLLLL